MATENTTTQLTGNFDSGDVDTVNVADSHHWQVVSGDPRGELTVDPVTGAWTFNLTGDFEYLSEGETLSSPLSYQVKVTDEHGASDTITVNFQVTGTNDAPTIVAANTVATGTVHEDPAGVESGTANGVVTIADVDHNDTHSYSLSNSGMVTEIQGTYGTLKLIAGDTPESVKWEYVLDQDKANSLNDGPVTENFDLFIESLVGGVAQGDAIKQTIEVTVEGRNDAAIVAPESQTHAETDAPLQMSGNLNSTDVDNPDDTFTVQNNKQGTYGTFSIDANGEWTFVANQAFNSLNVGQSVEETFAVTTIDGTPTSVTVKIEGTNDAATVSVGSVERDETDAPLTITDTLTSSDVDNADNTFTPSSKVGTYGTFSIDANGVWTFVAKESFDHLNVGQSVSETFDVTSVDGTPSTVTVKINGTNDAADISAATENLTESNSILTANGTLTADDPDNPNNVFVAQNGTVGNLGTFTLTAAGVWTFTAKSNFDNLAEGQKAEESFTVTSIDGTTSEVKIVITGTNDAATVSSADVTLQETDAVLSTSGTLTSTDIDNPDNKFQEQTNVAGNHGTFSIDADGNWTYIADESFNSLNVGQSVDDTFNVKSVDGTVSTVKVTIQGTNDAPSITGDFAKGVQEGVTDSVSGTVNITDVDSASVTRSLRNGTLSGDTFTATGQYGTLTFNVTTGVWAYVLLTGSSNALTGDQTATETFYIEATDGAPGGDSVQPITITVTGNKGQIGDSSIDDILTATSGDEWLFGNSIPTGGGISGDTDSQDTFRWETASLAGTDTIKDFDVRDFAATDPTVKHDVVDLTAVDFKADQQLTDQLSVSEQSGDTVIAISDSGAVLQSIVLEGVTLTSLLGVSQQEVDSMTPTEVLLALHQSEQLTLPDQIHIGTGASETLIGTDESDIIYGGGGNDILTGGDGFDLFLFTEEGAGTTTNPAEQTVTDFHIGDDKLDISDLLPDHDNLGDLLGNITITVNDDPNDNTDPATTVISVTNNGEQTDITLEGIGWNDLGIADSNVMTDQGNHQSELLNQLDHLSIIKVDP
ncbi:VCBS domain-containing protein [Vibrio barjaei]|uniref:VCBS domain-containing protein n=1 Tax=Vibrio barjaei TaxID=1676683 RepID=A0ABW7IPI3_9VIBR